MQAINPTNTLARPFLSVKSTEITHLTPSHVLVIHHKVGVSKKGNMIVSYSRCGGNTYGVSKAQRVLSPSLLMKKIEYVSDCLEQVLGLSVAQRTVVLRLLRYWAYYGQVYPKEAYVTLEPGCSKGTFWRTIRLLKERGLLQVVNRYVIRPHAQISNLYRLDKLVILIAKYLAEHITHRWDEWLMPYLSKPWPQLWQILSQSPEARAGPKMI